LPFVIGHPEVPLTVAMMYSPIKLQLADRTATTAPRRTPSRSGLLSVFSATYP